MKKRFFVLAAAFFCTQATAQQDTTLLDEAVITANRYSSKTSLSGKVVNSITKEQLENSGGKDLSQILAEQAGIFIAGANSNPGKEKSLYLRGARIDHTLITIDGIPVYDPAGIGGNFDIRNLNTGSIERIEILKGSQSTLYGSDAVAGVINIITQKSAARPVSAEIAAGYGSFGTSRINAGINGKKNRFDYQASLFLQESKGINEAEVNSLFPVTDRDGFKQRGVQTSWGIQPSGKIKIQPFFRFSRISGDIDQGAFVDELDYTYTQKSWQAGIRNELMLGKTKLNFLYSYNSIDRIYTDDSIKSRNGFDSWSQGKYRGLEHFSDAFIMIPINAGLKLTGGMDLRSSRSDQYYASVSSWGSYKTEYGADSLRQRQTGFYTTLNWNSRSGFNLEAGSRLTIHSAYGEYLVYNFNPSFLLNKKFRFFANLSSAFRTPSLYQLFSEYGNRDLRPESGHTMEGGMQYYAKDNRFTGRLVVFRRNVDNIIYFHTDPGTFRSQYINQDRQKDHGAELESTLRVNRDITLKAFYSYVTGRIHTVAGGKDTVYDNLLRRPRSSAGFHLSVTPGKKLFVSSQLTYTGKRKDMYFDPAGFTVIHTTLKDYLLWDIYADYAFAKNRLKLYAGIRNLTNSRYTEISGFRTLGINGSGGIRFRL